MAMVQPGMPVPMGTRMGSQGAFPQAQYIGQPMPQPMMQQGAAMNFQPRPIATAPVTGSTAALGGPPGPMSSASIPNTAGVAPRPAAVPQPPQGQMMRVVSSNGAPVTTVRRVMSMGGREQELDRLVAELKAQLAQKDQQVLELQTRLSKYIGTKAAMASPKPKAIGGSNGYRNLNAAPPATAYVAADQQDPIDVQLEEFYNSSGSAIPFRRINKGFYRFGDTCVEMTIINHKLMAKTEDGWNRGKFGTMDRFLKHYEALERERAGIDA